MLSGLGRSSTAGESRGRRLVSMNTVYVVIDRNCTEDCCTDYYSDPDPYIEHIYGIFDSRDQAEALAEAHFSTNTLHKPLTVEEYALNPDWQRAWYAVVRMNRQGELVDTLRRYLSTSAMITRVFSPHGFKGSYHLEYWASTGDVDAAVKTADEYRKLTLEGGCWPNGDLRPLRATDDLHTHLAGMGINVSKGFDWMYEDYGEE